MKNKTKRSIYVRIFGVFLAVYLVLMIAFSVFLVSEEKKIVDRELALSSTQISNSVVENLHNHLDSSNQIADLSEIKKNFVDKPIHVSIFDVPEVALFTSDYELIYHTNDYWRCAYNVVDGDTHSVRYGLLNPKDWFSEEEIKELENYLYAKPEVEKIGDLTRYLLSIYGLWMDNEALIPDKIVVSPMYATDFDENMNVVSSSADHKKDRVYSSNYKNTKGLPYFEHGGIMQEYNTRNDENRDKIRQMVTEQSKLKKSVHEMLESTTSRERVNALIYRYYMIVPYQNSVTILSENNFHSDFWTALALDINIGERISSTLLYVWTACFMIFSIAAYILSRQTYKTYLQQEKLEGQRKEMTDALAHDLKTPLSIISGYAQNLQEDVHSEKREHYASHINENVVRMDSIIGKMLEMSRLESDSFTLNLKEISLGEAANKTINRYKGLCDERSITISLEGDALVKADKSLIERVLDNFFINAMEHTPENGRISIKILDDRLEVFNSGSHILEDKIDEIWYPYIKVDAERSNTKGTGLGLSISRTILELHGFSYGAKNNEDGVTFWFKWL